MITHFFISIKCVYLYQYKSLKDARRMRKEWGTGEKEFGNLLDKERK